MSLNHRGHQNNYRKFIIKPIDKNYDIYIKELAKLYWNEQFINNNNNNSKTISSIDVSYKYIDEIIKSFNNSKSINSNCNFNDLKVIINLFFIFLNDLINEKTNQNQNQINIKEMKNQFEQTIINYREKNSFPSLSSSSSSSKTKQQPLLQQEIYDILEPVEIFGKTLLNSIISLNNLRIRKEYINNLINRNIEPNIKNFKQLVDITDDYKIDKIIIDKVKSFSIMVYNNENGDIINKEDLLITNKGKYRINNRRVGISYEPLKERNNLTKDSIEISMSHYGKYSIVPNINILKCSLNIMTNGLSSIIDFNSNSNGDDSIAKVYLIGGSLIHCLELLPLNLMKLYAKMQYQKRFIKLFKLSNLLQREIEMHLDGGSGYEFENQLRLQFEKLTTSNIDLVVCCKDVEKGKKRLQDLLNQIKEWLTNEKKWLFEVITHTPYSITIKGKKFKSIHISQKYKYIEEHLIVCDKDCTSVAFDGNNVLMTHRSINSFNTRISNDCVTNCRDPRSDINLIYNLRGFSIKSIQYCKHLDTCNNSHQSDFKNPTLYSSNRQYHNILPFIRINNTLGAMYNNELN